MSKAAAIEGCRSGPGDPADGTSGAVSGLPAMTPAQLRQQIDDMIERGWLPAIEHAGADNATADFWCVWKLPMFGETNVDRVLAEVETCRRAWPSHLVRLVGYDNHRQSQGASVVIHRPDCCAGQAG